MLLCWGATAIAVIGLGNIVGTFAAGWLGDRHRKKYVLSFFYLGRAAVLGMFLVAPVTEVSVLVFSALMGLLWLGTVPLTSGLVAQIFGPRYLGALFGIVFFSHQLGSFLGAWLGGYVYDTTGSYDAVWAAAVALGVVAAGAALADPRPAARPSGGPAPRSAGWAGRNEDAWRGGHPGFRLEHGVLEQPPAMPACTGARAAARAWHDGDRLGPIRTTRRWTASSATSRPPRALSLCDKSSCKSGPAGSKPARKRWTGCLLSGDRALSMGQYNRSYAILNGVIELRPNLSEGWNRRATLRYLMGDYEGSIADIDETLKLEPRHFGALSGLGLCHLRLGNEEEALDAFERALIHNPHMQGVKRNVKELRDRLGRHAI